MANFIGWINKFMYADVCSIHRIGTADGFVGVFFNVSILIFIASFSPPMPDVIDYSQQIKSIQFASLLRCAFFELLRFTFSLFFGYLCQLRVHYTLFYDWTAPGGTWKIFSCVCITVFTHSFFLQILLMNNTLNYANSYNQGG